MRGRAGGRGGQWQKGRDRAGQRAYYKGRLGKQSPDPGECVGVSRDKPHTLTFNGITAPYAILT